MTNQYLPSIEELENTRIAFKNNDANLLISILKNPDFFNCFIEKENLDIYINKSIIYQKTDIFRYLYSIQPKNNDKIVSIFTTLIKENHSDLLKNTSINYNSSLNMISEIIFDEKFPFLKYKPRFKNIIKANYSSTLNKEQINFLNELDKLFEKRQMIDKLKIELKKNNINQRKNKI
jgi:hypothetical protein